MMNQLVKFLKLIFLFFVAFLIQIVISMKISKKNDGTIAGQYLKIKFGTVNFKPVSED